MRRAGGYSVPGDYVHFKSQVPLHKISGYRVISVDIPCVWSQQEWIHSFEKFLDAVDIHHCTFSNALLCYNCSVNWIPTFLLKRHILMGIHDGPHEPFIADSVDFVVCQLETLSREDLASRLTLNTAAASVGRLQLSDSCITIMDTNDYCAIPQQLKDQVGDRYPGARRAFLKTGGDFPFLSRPDEVNLHLQLHLRHVGLEARPDLVTGASRDGNAGSPTEERRQGEPSDGNGSSNSRDSTADAKDTAPSSDTGAHMVDGQLLKTTKMLLARKDSRDMLSLLLVYMERTLLLGASELLFRPSQVSSLSPLTTMYAGVLNGSLLI
ncbi:unnamed protein product [Victoria cruziana]